MEKQTLRPRAAAIMTFCGSREVCPLARSVLQPSRPKQYYVAGSRAEDVHAIARPGRVPLLVPKWSVSIPKRWSMLT